MSSRLLDHESETGNSSSAKERHRSRPRKAVLGLGLGSRRRSTPSSRSHRLHDRGRSRGTLVVAGVSRDRAAGGVGRVRVAALETDVCGGGDLDESVGWGGADVGGLAEGLAVGVHVDVGCCFDVGGQDGDEGAGFDDVGAADEVGDDGGVGVCGGAGGVGGCGGGAAVVSVAVCCCQGGEAEEEEVGDFELHVCGWFCVVWLIDDAREKGEWLIVLESQ